MQRYFCKEDDGKFILSKEDSYHITKVMRYYIGDKIEVVDNEKLYIAEIINDSPFIVAKKVKEVPTSFKKLNITVVQSLVNEQKMDYILQKGTELGVDTFIPLVTTRSVVKVNDKIHKKVERWNTIVKEASEQSKRTNIPTVLKPYSIKEITELDYDYKILCSVNEVSKSIKTVLSNIKESDRILLVIGPEGGFTEEEEKELIQHGYISVTLGDRVLRTETASLFVVSIINYILMR